MGAVFSKNYQESIQKGQTLHSTLTSNSNSLAYHILAATIQSSDERLQKFLKNKQPNLFIDDYKSLLKEGEDAISFLSGNDQQLILIQDCAKNFSESMERKRVDALDLFFGCCEAIMALRNNNLQNPADRWVASAYQIMKDVRSVHRTFNDLKNMYEAVGGDSSQITLIHGNNQDYMDFFYDEEDILNEDFQIPKEDHAKLSKYASLMNHKTFEPFFGRSTELQQVKEILAQTRKNNPLLIGEAGVGKTAIVEGLVQEIKQNDILYPEGQKPQIYNLNLGALMADTKMRGDLEKKIKDVIEIAERNKGKLILFIDEIHSLLNGTASKEVAETIKPALGRGDMTVIGATTIDEYRQYIEKNKALNRRFDVVHVDEPDRNMTLQMLQNSVYKMERSHRVEYTKGALEASYDLVKRYQPNVAMPDGAFSILDKAGAKKSLSPTGGMQLIHSSDIAEAISAKTGIPLPQLTQDDGRKTLQLKGDLTKKVFEQDKAIDALVRAVQSSVAGLREDSKTRGAFLFSGPTGVGKTEAAKVLSETIGAELIRIDMSEYQNEHSLSKLIGAPPGYIGYNQGGVLSEAVTKNPHAVVLLDEVEKAHPSIYTVLLQTLDNGFLKDGQGRNVDFRNTYIIMTTNAGQADKKKSATIGFTGAKEDTETVSKALNNMFAPELRNRLDAIVEFDKLGQAGILKVAGKMLSEKANTLFKNKGITLEFTETAKEQVAKGGFDPAMGARPLGRYIQQNIDPVLSFAILQGSIRKGDTVQVDFKAATEGEAPKFAYEKLRKSANDDVRIVVRNRRLALTQS